MTTARASTRETLIFVYDTLRHGEPNHRLLSPPRFLRHARTTASYDLVDLGAFPAMVAGGANSVEGELYAVNQRVLADLDRLEGHPCFYRRTAVNLEDGAAVEAYLMPSAIVAGRPRIASGDWLDRGEEETACESKS